MKVSDWLHQNYVYIVVVSLLAMLVWIMTVFTAGKISTDEARVYLEAMTALATLALLYYAYFNVASKREEDTARLELAVRPILLWEIESDGAKANFTYKTIKHPLYDFRATLQLEGEALEINDRHLDVAEAHPGNERVRDVTNFISHGLGKGKINVLELTISYHSEVGGRYEFFFTKEVLRKKNAFVFQHRKFVSAKYPWRTAPVTFDDE